MTHHYPSLSRPKEIDIRNFVACVVRSHVDGSITSKEYYVTLGKALVYVEWCFAVGLISRKNANLLIDDIQGRL